MHSDLDSNWDQIGTRVRESRNSAGITVRELARRIGVSASHVSQVERGIGAFSVPTLYSVARELGMTMNELLDPQQEAQALEVEKVEIRDLEADGIVQRNGDHPSITLQGGPHWRRLTPTSEPQVEFLEVIYEPGTVEDATLIQHAGSEYGFIIEGELTVEVEGISTVLQPGDTIVFNSMRPHRFWNDTDAVVRAIWFVLESEKTDQI